MTSRTLRIAFAHFLCTAALLAPLAGQAQLFRAYLDSHGSDSNPCTLPQPCRLLQAALAAVADGGEIWMLDSANFNTTTVTIGKSVAISAVPGATGSIVANGGHAINITAPGLKVVLRHLVVTRVPGASPGNGVNLQAASSLKVEDCVFSSLPTTGIYAAAPGSSLTVWRSVFRDNPGFGLFIENGTQADITNSLVAGNGVGLHLKAGSAVASKATISGTTFSGNTYGVEAFADAVNGSAIATLMGSTLANNTQAMRSTTGAGGSADIFVGSSLVHGNASSWFVQGAGAVVGSYGNNQIPDINVNTGPLTQPFLR